MFEMAPEAKINPGSRREVEERICTKLLEILAEDRVGGLAPASGATRD